MNPTAVATDSLVAFENSQGDSSRGTLIHLTRHQAVFEVYNPYSIVQLSEVLHELAIFRQDRQIYGGRAVVSNLVSTGLMLIVTVTLVDPWSDLAGLAPGDGISMETRRFVHDWEISHDLRPSFQLAISSIRNFLEELSRWLQGTEVAVAEPRDHDRDGRLQREFVEEIHEPTGAQTGRTSTIRTVRERG